MGSAPVIRCGRPHTFGWLRRPELEDTRHSEIWEAPNGALVPKPLGWGKRVIYAPVEPVVLLPAPPSKDGGVE